MAPMAKAAATAAATNMSQEKVELINPLLLAELSPVDEAEVDDPLPSLPPLLLVLDADEDDEDEDPGGIQKPHECECRVSFDGRGKFSRTHTHTHMLDLPPDDESPPFAAASFFLRMQSS